MQRAGLHRVALAAVLVAAAGSTATAQTTSADCSSSFHAALGPLRDQAAPALSGLLSNLRKPDPDLTGRWLFAQALFTKPQGRPRRERVCVKTRRVRDRDVCRRFEMREPRRPSEITTRTPPSPEDLRLLRGVHDVVTGKGGLPDVGPNGRQVSVIARAAGEVRSFLTQPAHPFLCSGVPDLVTFYAAQVAPLTKRYAEVQTLAAQLREAAAIRTRDIAVAERAAWDRAAAAAAQRAGAGLTSLTKAIAESRPAEAGPQAPPPALPAMPAIDLPPLPPEPAPLPEVKALNRTALIKEGLRPLLPAAVAAATLEAGEPIAILMKARAAFLDPNTQRGPIDPSVADAAIAALRLIEASVYADRYAARHAVVEQAFGGTFSAIRAAHGKTCTCRDTN